MNDSCSCTGNQHVLDDNGIFVTKITKGGVADQHGQIEVGDRVLEVNGQNMVEIDHEDAVAILKATGQEVTLKIEKNSLPQDITVTSDEGKVSGCVFKKQKERNRVLCSWLFCEFYVFKMWNSQNV